MAAADTPFKFRQPLNFEETVLSTPRPQASSTEDRKRDIWLDDSMLSTANNPPTTIGNGETFDQPCGFLRSGIDTLAMLKSRLAQAGLVPQPLEKLQNTPQVDVTNLIDISASMSGIGSSLNDLDLKDLIDASCSESLSCYDIGPNFKPTKFNGPSGEVKTHAIPITTVAPKSHIPISEKRAASRQSAIDGEVGESSIMSSRETSTMAGLVHDPAEKDLHLQSIHEIEPKSLTTMTMGKPHRLINDLGMSMEYGFGCNDFVDFPMTEQIFDSEGTMTKSVQEDLERSLARQKAYETLNSSYSTRGLQQSISEGGTKKDSNFSLPDCPKFSLTGAERSTMLSQGKEDSGFSVVMQGAELAQQLSTMEDPGLSPSSPLPSSDITLSGVELTGEEGCKMFMPAQDSFLQTLGPTDPPKAPRSPKTDRTVTLDSASSGIGSVDDITRLVMQNEFSSAGSVTSRPPPIGSDNASATVDQQVSRLMAKAEEEVAAELEVTQSGADSTGDSSVLNLDELREVLADIPVGLSHQEILEKLLTTAPKSRPSSQASSANSQCDRNGSVSSEALKSTFNEALSGIGLDKCYNASTLVGCEVYVRIEATSECEISEIDKTKVLGMISCTGNGGTTVLLMPLKAGDLRIVVCEGGKHAVAKRHIIELISEEPKIELLSSIQTDFGILPDQCTEKRTVLLRNNNISPVSLLYSFKQDFGGTMCFELAEGNGDPASQVIEIMPGEMVRKDVIVNTPHMDTSSGPKTLTIHGELSFVLKTFEYYRRVVGVARVALSVRSVRARLQIKRACAEQTYPANEPRSVGVFNASDIDLVVRMKVEPEEFRVSDKYKTMPPNSLTQIDVTYTPQHETASTTGTGVFYLQIMPFGQVYRVPLTKGESISQTITQSPAESICSRPVSPKVCGLPLNLNCTNRHLVWSSVPLNSHVEKSCCLRNGAQYREKLIFSIDDPSNSFFFVKDGEKMRQLKVMLDPMQKRELMVTLSPITHGQLRATIVVTRVQKDNERKAIGLLGFGGRGHMRVDSVAMDLETDVRKLLLDSTTLSTTFSLHNIGDGDSYFYITQPCIEGRFLEVKPTLGKLSPGTRTQVSLRFTANASSIEELLRDNKNDTEIKVSNILITHGDHPTKLRLARLYKKYGKSCDDKEIAPIMKSLSELTSVFSEQAKWDQKVITELKDPLGSVCSLYKDGVRQWSIHVIISRHVLEAALLDSTQQFTVLEDSVMIEESLIPTSVNIETSFQPSCNFSLESFLDADKYSLAQALGISQLDRFGK